MLWFFTRKVDERNPYGETVEEFKAKYPGMEHICDACWYLGVRPEEFAKEVRQLVEMPETGEKG